MTEQTKKEWDEILAEDIYIYGAGKTAEKICRFLLERGGDVKGFVVTDVKDNPSELLDRKVEDIHFFTQKEACILVPHMWVYRDEIAALLKQLGFVNVRLIAQLLAKTQFENLSVDVDWREDVSDDEHVEIRKQVLGILEENSPEFGGTGLPLQSLERIGLKGGRSTENRIEEYELRTILKAGDDVLDIGCNTGFLDIEVAGLVHSVTGVEYDKNLVRVAELVQDYLNISNCCFYSGDFREWYKQSDKVYDVIFSFAVHHWLNLSPQEYVAILDHLLKEEGYICFESHIYGTDEKANEIRRRLREMGYQIICDKKVGSCDLMKRERDYILFKKCLVKV